MHNWRYVCVWFTVLIVDAVEFTRERDFRIIQLHSISNNPERASDLQRQNW
jgi:hypothetical protein